MAERSRKKPSSKQPKSFKEISLDEISTDNFIFLRKRIVNYY